MKSKVITFTEPFQVELDEIELPELEDNQILTKTLMTGVSTGTETRVLSGKQDGAAFPLIPGYENLGEIVETGKSVSLNKGTKVFVGSSMVSGKFNSSWGAHQEYAIANVESVVPVKNSTSDEEAIFIKIGAISLHGVKRAKIGKNENVVVIGLGLIGTLAALCAKSMGANVIAADIDNERLKYLEATPIDKLINSSDSQLNEVVLNEFGRGADVVIDASGNSNLTNYSAQLLKDKDWDNLYHESGRLMLLGSYVEDLSFNYNDSLFMKEIDILASRDTVLQDLVDMCSLIENKKVDINIIPQKVYKVEDAQTAYNELINKKLMRIAFDWRNL